MFKKAWIVFGLTLFGMASEHAWKDYHEVSGAKVSNLNVNLILSCALPVYQLAGLSTWEGDTSDGLATGLGRLTVSTIVGEAGGFKKFAKSVTLTGQMKDGSFDGKVEVIVANPHMFPEKIGDIYTDGNLAFHSYEEFLKHNELYQAELKRLQAEITRLKAIKDPIKRVEEAVASLSEHADGDSELKSTLMSAWESYKKVQTVVDPFIGTAINVISKKLMGKAILTAIPYGGLVYGAYVLFTQLS